MKHVITLCLFLLMGMQLSYAQADKYQLSIHILDIAEGHPAPGVRVALQKMDAAGKDWLLIKEDVTNDNGAIRTFLPITQGADNKGRYKLVYYTQEYFDQKGLQSFYPYIEVIFDIKDDTHYHVPITLSPFGYGTYRGS